MSKGWARRRSACRSRMGDVWLRLAVVGGALLVSGSIVLLRRMRTRRIEVEYDSVPLGPGVYLFSSSTCSTCDRARDKLGSRLGGDAYREYVWEDHAELFSDLAIDVVPAVLVVGESGAARLYHGQPDRALARMGK